VGVDKHLLLGWAKPGQRCIRRSPWRSYGWAPFSTSGCLALHVEKEPASCLPEATEEIRRTAKDVKEMRTTDEIRKQMVLNAEWSIDHASSIHYAEIRPIPVHSPAHHTPLTLDCSSCVTMIAKWAGAPDPNGNSYNGSGYTGTLLSHLPHIGQSHAKRGDLVVYGDGTGEHVVMLLQDVAHHPDPLVVSHGEESGPSRYLLSTETSFFIAGTRQTFLRTVYDCHRQEATGNSSLDWVANHRQTSVASLINVTRNSHTYGNGYYGISDADLALFNEYAQGGTDKKMPKGLVFYTLYP
jgi:hypothetical protein